METPIDAVVFGADPRVPFLTQRSVRSLKAAGFVNIRVCRLGESVDLREIAAQGLLLLRAGAWLRIPGNFKAPPSGGSELVAVGHVVGGGPAEGWSSFFELHGGDFSSAEVLPPCICEWISLDAIRQGVAEARISGIQIPPPIRGNKRRVVHWFALNAGYDAGWRTLQIVTSLQHGGAEKIGWELTRTLPAQGMATRIVVLGKPLRGTLPELSATVDISGLDRAGRAERLGIIAHAFGADCLHGHLIDGEDARLFSKHGIPLAMTIHNTRNAWPAGVETLAVTDAALILACSLEVERELRDLELPIPVRTIWNGVDPQVYARERLPRSPDAPFTMVCVANPRAQKRLHLLPAILAATQREFSKRNISRPVKLIIAGEVSPRSPEAVVAFEKVQEETLREGVAAHISWTQGLVPVPVVLSQADVVVCTSAYEGLSLAHMEALAAGLPLISTDAGGTRELAPGNPVMTLLALDATPEQFAETIANVCQGVGELPNGRDTIIRDFSVERMAARVKDLLQCLNQPRGETVWFITNNLSTGGAQSSLRRLAGSFAAEGISVRVVLLQEHVEFPTAGREHLIRLGVPVFVAPPAGSVDAGDAVHLILREINAAPAKCVVFWNVIPVYKMLLADALLHVPVYEVSPGEMLFASLERYFQKPRPALPYRDALSYGRRLAGVIVKYAAEAPRAAEVLGAPVHVISNGVSLPEAPIKSSSSAVLVFGTAARLSPQKRLEALIEAFRVALPRLPACELHIAGGPEHDSTDYAKHLRELARDLPVNWLGEVQDMATFHAGLDVFVMISEPSGCPNASLEAMAAGLPMIATDVGGASEQVLNGVGLLTPRHDAAALAEAMIQLADNSELRRTMGAAARKHITEHFSMERMANEYRRVLGL